MASLLARATAYLLRGSAKAANLLADVLTGVSTPVALQAWHQVDGDKILRLDYDLTPDSIVVDVGGYEGQWASDIFGRYCCTVHVFEPVPEFVHGIARRFHGNHHIIVHPFGLSNQTATVAMGIHRDSSSAYRHGNTQVLVLYVRAADLFDRAHIHNIHLMKINIEGGEYELLDHLIDEGCIRHIENVQVQFHADFPDAQERMESIQGRLRNTHRLTYQYPFVWENWQRRPDALS